MNLAIGLVRVSAALFAAIGLGYLLAPGAMLSIVGVRSEPTTEFLMRTEGVALLTGAGLLWAVSRGSERELRIALVVLAGYYVLGSIVDVAASGAGIVGTAAVPSAIIRILVGAVCGLAATRLPVR